MNKSKIIYIFIACALAGSAIGVQQFIHKIGVSGTSSPTNINDTGGRSPDGGNVEMSMSTGASYADDKVLVGDSHDIFVGKVLRKTGNRQLPDSVGPSSQYDVNVILNIKGNLPGSVTVNQFEIHDPVLLQVGSTYIFATRYVPVENVYKIAYYHYNYELLTDNSVLSDSELKTTAENSDRVKALQAAYPKEISSTDVRDNMAWNSYASRHYDAQGNLIDDTVELAAGRSIPSLVPVSPTPTPSPVTSPALSPADQRDKQRVDGLRKLQMAIELYVDANGSSYPYPSGCPATGAYTPAQAASCFTSLSTYLVPTYVGALLPVDPLNTGSYQFGYVPGDQKSPPADCGSGPTNPCLHYLLEATMENPNSPYLANSIHGATGGFSAGNGYNCAAPVYCVGENPSMAGGKHNPSSTRPASATPVPSPAQAPSNGSGSAAPPPPPPPPAP